jgi:FMN phosphatase YigB (HAD superfamily)
MLIFALDDLLIDTSLYWSARAAYARTAGGGAPEIADWADETGATPRKYRSMPDGAAVSIHSVWDTFQKTCDPAQRDEMDVQMRMAQSLRSPYPTLVPGAADLLKWAYPLFSTVLLTTGDQEAELAKVDAAKIRNYFKQIKIVPAKGAEAIRALMAEMGFSPRNTWVLGSSLPVEINPAIEAGAHCIYYVNANRAKDTVDAAGPIFRIHLLDDARSILAKPTAG